MQKGFWIALQSFLLCFQKKSQDFTENNQRNGFKSITKCVWETKTKGTVSSLFLGADKSRTCKTSPLVSTTQNTVEMSLYEVSDLNKSETPN